MNILLIWPPQFHLAAADYMRRVQRGLGFLPPLGLMYLASWLHSRTSHRAEILDAYRLGLSLEATLKEVERRKPQAVGISCLTHTWYDCHLLAQALKERFPDLPIILGGPHCTLFPKESLASGVIDYCIAGDGEWPLGQLLDSLEGGQELKHWPGVTARGQEPSSPFILQDLQDLPVADRSLCDWRSYVSVVSACQATTTIMSARGCPYGCRFCFTAGGRKVRAFSPQRTVEEIVAAYELGIREFFFFDELFTYSQERVLSFCEELEKLKLKISWDVRSRVDTVNKEMLQRMASCGCRRIQYGIESGSQRILEVLHKGITKQQAASAVKWTREAGIETYADFMLGCPGESQSEMAQTVEFALELPLDYVHFAVLMLYPQTYFYRQALEQGLLEEDVWQAYALNPTSDFRPPYWPGEHSAQHLEELTDKAFKSFCLRPSFICRRLRSLRSWGQLSRQVAAAWQLLAGGKYGSLAD